MLDATYAPQNMRFSTDASLLNEARKNAEAIIDVFHENGLTDCEKKPRTYREKAKHQYNGFSKSRKKDQEEREKSDSTSAWISETRYWNH